MLLELVHSSVEERALGADVGLGEAEELDAGLEHPLGVGGHLADATVVRAQPGLDRTAALDGGSDVGRTFVDDLTLAGVFSLLTATAVSFAPNETDPTPDTTWVELDDPSFPERTLGEGVEPTLPERHGRQEEGIDSVLVARGGQNPGERHQACTAIDPRTPTMTDVDPSIAGLPDRQPLIEGASQGHRRGGLRFSLLDGSFV